MRMLQAQSSQLLSGVTACSYNTDLYFVVQIRLLLQGNRSTLDNRNVSIVKLESPSRGKNMQIRKAELTDLDGLMP